MKDTIRFPHGLRATAFVIAATVIFSFSFCLSNSQADPTLVVDVDTGIMEIYVGDDALSLPKPVVGCSWAEAGTCPMDLTDGGWPAMTNFDIVSAGSSLNADSGGVASVLQAVLADQVNGYSEGIFVGDSSFSDGTVLPLAVTYNTSFDTRDLLWNSNLNGTPSNWNTLYISSVPEPSTIVLFALGTFGLASRKRRYP